MKTKNLFSVALLLLVVFSSFSVSCKSDDDGEGGGGTAAEGTITAKVNGSNFTSLEMATSGQMVTAGGTTTLMILGSSMDQNGIALNISGLDGTGTYQIGGGANVFVNASYTEANVSNPMNSQVWQAPYDDSVAGEISISELSETKAKGTFHFSAKNVNGDGSIKNITEGSFNVTLQ